MSSRLTLFSLSPGIARQRAAAGIDSLQRERDERRNTRIPGEKERERGRREEAREHIRETSVCTRESLSLSLSLCVRVLEREREKC